MPVQHDHYKSFSCSLLTIHDFCLLDIFHWEIQLTVQIYRHILVSRLFRCHHNFCNWTVWWVLENNTSICHFSNISRSVLAWLTYVWSEVQMLCIWCSWCHCHCHPHRLVLSVIVWIEKECRTPFLELSPPQPLHPLEWCFSRWTRVSWFLSSTCTYSRRDH